MSERGVEFEGIAFMTVLAVEHLALLLACPVKHRSGDIRITGRRNALVDIASVFFLSLSVAQEG